MTDDEKRKIVADEYPSDNWKARVAKMRVSQVTAIYLRILSERKI